MRVVECTWILHFFAEPHNALGNVAGHGASDPLYVLNTTCVNAAIMYIVREEVGC